jgi:hypothetical protein
MTPDQLAERGRVLFGPRWQSELARGLGVSDRTMRRWVSGSSAVPDGIVQKLEVMMEDRLFEMRGLLARLRPAGDAG